MLSNRVPAIPRGSVRASILATGLTAFGVVAVGVAPAAAHALPANCSQTGSLVECTFEYNGTDGSDGSAQTWTVPPGVTEAFFDLLGAEGGGDEPVYIGGRGGNTVGTVSLTPGTTVTILVGGAGDIVITGFNGGGDSGLWLGGGGATDIRIGGATLADRVLVAGGGGGAGALCSAPLGCPGGDGGGTVGGDGGAAGGDPPVGGRGGTQTEGGDGGGAFNGEDGAFGVGGAQGGLGGGGGGGYYGGGGGGGGPVSGGSPTGGGGGSGFVHPTLVTGGSTVAGVRQGSGLVTLSYTAPSKLPQTITFPPLPDRSIVESPVRITGVSGGGSGKPVTFTSSGQCQVNGARVTLLRTGTCTVTAHQAGNHAYLAAPAVSRSFTIVGKPSLRIGDRSIHEGDSGTRTLLLPVTLSRAVSVPVTVSWRTVNGSARAPGDYTAASGTVTFAPWQTSRSIAITVKGDHAGEPTEVFTVVLSAPTRATIADGTGRGSIVNDD